MMKTTDPLTFFQPQESFGTASTFSLQARGEPAREVWVFAREKVNLSRFAGAAMASDDDCTNLLREVYDALRPGGGLLICARPHDDAVKVQLWRVKAPDYSPPKRMLRLTPCGDALFENITDSCDLQLGEHLLLPVSKDAEARLHALREHLKGLPSDLESSVLNIIRRPSLEWRIERIERALSMPAGGSARQRSRARSGRLLDRLGALLMRPIPVGPAIGAALLLMASAVLAYQKLPLGHGENGITNLPAGTASSDELAAPLGELRKALASSKQPGIQGLYSTHLQDLRFWQSDKPTPAFWGVAKLQALQMGTLAGNDKMLAKTGDQTAIKSLYAKNGEALRNNDKALDLLGWMACQGPTRTPELPPTADDPKPLPLPGSRACDDLKPAAAAAGLEALADWVNGRQQ
jgi:hypothetical protein